MPSSSSTYTTRSANVSTSVDWRRWATQHARLYMDTLRHQARVERHLRLLAEERAGAQRRAGETASAQARTQRERIGHMQREVGIQWEIARWGAFMGLEETALRALRAIASLQDRIALLAQEIRAAPYQDAIAQIREWHDALAARTELLRALRAPDSDLQRLHAARVDALQREARILAQMGRLPDAERALAQAARLGDQSRADAGSAAVRERIRQAIAGDARDADRVAPLAVTQGSRRYVVEFQAPTDRGAAIVDALIDEVMRRLGDTLRAQR